MLEFSYTPFRKTGVYPVITVSRLADRALGMLCYSAVASELAKTSFRLMISAVFAESTFSLRSLIGGDELSRWCRVSFR